MDDRSTDDPGRGDDPGGAGDTADAGDAGETWGAREAPEDHPVDANADADEDGALHVATEGESWRFSLDDLDEEPEDRITPGSPSLEHAAFVLLGVAATAVVILQLLL